MSGNFDPRNRDSRDRDDGIRDRDEEWLTSDVRQEPSAGNPLAGIRGGGARQLASLLPRAAEEDEPPLARFAARSWKPSVGARCRSPHGAAVPESCEHLHEQSLPETVEARTAHDDSPDRHAVTRERRGGKMGTGTGRDAEKIAAGATKRTTS